MTKKDNLSGGDGKAPASPARRPMESDRRCPRQVRILTESQCDRIHDATLTVLAMLAAELADSGAEAELVKVPGAIARVLDLDDEAARIAADMAHLNRCIILGRGYHYATAREWSLKLKELSYTLADPYSTADFIHGPLALVEAGFPTFCVAPRGATEGDMAQVIERLGRELAARLLIISDDDALRDRAHWSLPLPPDVPEWLMPIVSIVPAQLQRMMAAMKTITGCKGLIS